jgi:prophage regulatory protein
MSHGHLFQLNMLQSISSRLTSNAAKDYNARVQKHMTALQEHQMPINVTLTAAAPRPPRILRLHQVAETVGLSRASIYRLMNLGLFPKSVRIGMKAVGWVQAEVEMWIIERQIEQVTF